MFDIEICSSPPVVLVRFRGQLTEDDFLTLARMAGEARGAAEYDSIFDFSNVERVGPGDRVCRQAGRASAGIQGP
jgi:hypothetical protein